MSHNTTLVCPSCGASKFEKQRIVSFDGKKEKLEAERYVCQNGFCLRVSDRNDLQERKVETVSLLEAD